MINVAITISGHTTYRTYSEHDVAINYLTRILGEQRHLGGAAEIAVIDLNDDGTVGNTHSSGAVDLDQSLLSLTTQLRNIIEAE